MLTISKPLGAAQLRTYHAEEFSNARGNYYTTTDELCGQWHGRLARQWGLVGDVRAEAFQRLAEGQHPLTGDQLVRHQTARTYTNAQGDHVTTMAHRAGWDATFSAPKSVSLTALVGGDARVRAAHRASVRVALDEIERYVQARIGRDHPAETTGRWVAAAFEHDSARPVDGYAAPQLHTHVVFFNVTERAPGETRALQPRELYKTQQYATAVYRSALATRLVALGYAIDRGNSGQPEIRGYSAAYLEVSSPRRQQIAVHLAEANQRGAGAAQIAAHRTREAKLEAAAEEMRRRHRALAEAFGHQPAHVVEAARARAQGLQQSVPGTTAREAMTFATARNLEREAVVDERALLRDALRRSMADVPVQEIKAECERRLGAGQLLAATQPPGAPGRAFTTPEMIALERDTIRLMLAGQQTCAALVTGVTRHEIEQAHARLSQSQRAAVQQLLASRDQVLALEGVAGAGKTTALAAVRDGAERDGYRVEGLAPTSRAAQELGRAGIVARTLQRHLIDRGDRDEPQDRPRRPHLYVLDESSLASTVQLHAFLQRLRAEDRVLLVGDVRQHQAVEAGRPYQQLQEAGVETVRLDAILRQRDLGLKQVVEHLARGEVGHAVHQLEAQGRVHEIIRRDDRLAAIARGYVEAPEGTLVISPDNRSRSELNQIIHGSLQRTGHVGPYELRVRVLVSRQEITGADRQWAEQYAPGDVVRYAAGSQVLGLRAGEYARVAQVHAAENRLTVTRATGELVTYDPRRLQGVTLYREAERGFAVGDRVQITAPDRTRRVANRELGTLTQIQPGGRLQLRLDSGRLVAFAALDRPPHLDYGYAVTSHSSQGQTADRVLVHVDTDRLGETLVNQRLAYVAISRARYDAQIYTNDRAQLAEALGRQVTHRVALEVAPTREALAQAPDPRTSPNQQVAEQAVGHTRARGIEQGF